MKSLAIMDVFDVSHKLSLGIQKVKHFLNDYYFATKSIGEHVYLYEKELKGDDILQLIEEADGNYEKFQTLISDFRTGKQKLEDVLYGEKLAFPIVMIGNEEGLVIVRQSQIPFLLQEINTKTITRNELIDHTEGVSFVTNLSLDIENVPYERSQKEVIAKQVTLLTTEPVIERLPKRQFS